MPLIPSSLEELTIKHADDGFWPVLDMFLAGDLPPSLKTIVTEFYALSLHATNDSFDIGLVYDGEARARGINLLRRRIESEVYCKNCLEDDVRVEQNSWSLHRAMARRDQEALASKAIG